LGLGVMSFFTAFVLSYPIKLKSKAWFLTGGILGIQFLNIIRFVLLALFWNSAKDRVIDHHAIFNIILYIIIAVTLYIWVKRTDKLIDTNAAN